MKLPPEPVCEAFRTARRFGDVSPQFLPESVRKHFRVASRFSDVSSKFLVEPFRKYLCVAPGFGDVGTQRLSRRADDSLNLCQRFLIHIPSVAKSAKSKILRGRSQRLWHRKLARFRINPTISVASNLISRTERGISIPRHANIEYLEMGWLMPSERRSLSQVQLEPLILVIRNQRVILDADLARLYGVPTKRFNEAFKGNRRRFPDNFAFLLTTAEFNNLRSHVRHRASSKLLMHLNPIHGTHRKTRWVKLWRMSPRTGRNLRPVPAVTVT